MRNDLKSYDVAVIGAGPVGCATALAFAKNGAHVLLLEANPKASATGTVLEAELRLKPGAAAPGIGFLAQG